MKRSRLLIALLLMCASAGINAQDAGMEHPDVLRQVEESGDFAPMFPFQPTHNAPDNITNVSTWAGAHREEAGAAGFVTPAGDDFVDGDGNKMRFIGTQCGMTGCFPTHEQADRLAKEFSRYGINIVRMHYVSHRNPKDGYPVKDSFIEPVQLERFDYFIARLKENGIYVYFQLNIARKFSRVNGFENAHKLPKYKNGVDNVNERMVGLQQKFHKEILEHINPYTGLAYKDEPCISMMEIANENSIVHSWFSPKHKFPSLVEPYKSEFIGKWNGYLKRKYGDTKTLKSAWGETVPVKSRDLEKGLLDWPYMEDWELSSQRAQDFIEFLAELENAYFPRMYHNLKENLGIRQPVTGTQLGYGFHQAQAGMDYCDMHCYWCHPAFPGGGGITAISI